MKEKRMHEPALTIRPAREDDVLMILKLIKELAVYEKLSDQVIANEKDLRKYLFGENSYAEVHLAFWQDQLAGYALFFHNFSTFVGRPGLYIEDIYVREKYRGNGIGKALLMECVRIARERNCQRVEWLVLNWNPARKFYEKLGAYPLQEWTVYRLDKNGINNLLDPDFFPSSSPVIDKNNQ